jgi:trans-aconitate 2-methyltransferase
MQDLADEVLAELVLRGDETVLDAGCGSGRVTEALIERVPRGRVIAVDGSADMIAAARERLGDRVELHVADLLELELEQPVDVVFSTATFHWIADHDRLFAALHRVLKPEGTLVTQFGGGDNLAGFMHAADVVASRPSYAAELGGKHLWRFFYTPEQERTRLLAAGFQSADAWLEPSPQTFDSHQSLADFVRAVVLSSHVAALPDHLRDNFVHDVVDEVVRRHGAPMLDYVRLNVDATA